PQPVVVKERTFAALGAEQVVGRGVVDDAGHDRAFPLERERDGEVRDPVQEVHGAVERIDNPGVGLVAALAPAPFLANETVTRSPSVDLLPPDPFTPPLFLAIEAGPRPRWGAPLAQDLSGGAAGGGHKFGRPLERPLQLLDLAEVALGGPPGFASGLDHPVEGGGGEHAVCGLPATAG